MIVAKSLDVAMYIIYSQILDPSSLKTYDFLLNI